jgi:hypothetical protein
VRSRNPRTVIVSHFLTGEPYCARAHPLACNRHVPWPTQRTHAIGLWVARNTAWCPPFSAQDPL